MEGVARVDVEPLQRRGVTGERHHTHPGAGLRSPAIRKGSARRVGDVLHRQIDVEHHGQVPEHCVGLGDREVVHHHRRRQIDRFAEHQRAVRLGDVIREQGRSEAVPERVHPTGDGIDLRMSGERRRERATEVVRAHGGQIVGAQFVRQAHLAAGEQAAAVPDARHVRLVRRATGWALTEAGTRPVQRRVDVAIAVGDGSSSFESDTVHHAVTEEPVRRVGTRRIRAVAHVRARELRGNRAAHGERRRLHLVGHRCEVALHPPRTRRVDKFGRRWWAGR